MKIKSIFKTEISPRTGWILMFLLMMITVFHYSMYNYQNDIMNNRFKAINKSYNLSTWRDIEGIIDISTLSAKTSSEHVATDIVNRINSEYSDINILRREFDSGNYNSAKFTKILIDSINNKYMFDIKTRQNDIFVMNKNGILADMNVEKFNTIHRQFTEEVSSHFNTDLAFKSLEAIILKKANNNLIFYEQNYPDNDTHIMITTPSLEQMKEVYEKEGLEGLKNYTILVPAYITDDGDLFGNPDISDDGTVNMTHKIIVVQRFSIYDVIHKSFMPQFDLKHQMYENMLNNIKETKDFYTFTFVAMILLDMILMLFFLIYTTGNIKPKASE